LDIEFEQAWETTSDWNEDDVDAVTEEWGVCWGDEEENQGEGDGEGGRLDAPTGYAEMVTNGRG
jgi:hypothetical protein